MDMGNTDSAIPWARSTADSVTAAGGTPVLYLGGDADGVHKRLQIVTANPTILKTFVSNLLAAMSDMHMKGIDIDWDPILPEDEQPILNLLKALHSASPAIQLSMPIKSVHHYTNFTEHQALASSKVVVHGENRWQRPTATQTWGAQATCAPPSTLVVIGTNFQLCLPQTVCAAETCPPSLGTCTDLYTCTFKAGYQGLATFPHAYSTYYCELATGGCHGITQNNFPEVNAATIANNLNIHVCGTAGASAAQDCVGIAASSPMVVGNSQETLTPTGDHINNWGQGLTEQTGMCYRLTGPTGKSAYVALTDRCGGYCTCKGSGVQECGPCVNAADMKPQCPCVGTVPGLNNGSCCGLPNYGCPAVVNTCDWCSSNNHPHFDLDQDTYAHLSDGQGGLGSFALTKIQPVSCMTPLSWPPGGSWGGGGGSYYIACPVGSWDTGSAAPISSCASNTYLKPGDASWPNSDTADHWCCSNTASGGGTTPSCAAIAQCTAYNADCTCASCAAGYTGASCSACAVSHCASYSSGCTCASCTAGYTGATCASACSVAHCTSYSSGCTCQTCSSGYAGASCADVNECATSNGGCDSHAICQNNVGAAPTCSCNAGYSGNGASCAACSVAHCASYSSGCTCQTCAAGFAGAACADINECATNNGGCDSHASCQNLVGIAPSCTCNSGYSGSGLVCSTVNSCATNNGGCDAHATCANGASGAAPSCVCNSGYSGTGASCADINECATNNGGCSSHATCSNQIGNTQPLCACNSGYSGTGQVCSAINQCAVNNGGCDMHATCANGASAAICVCNIGYAGSGASCADINECATNHGGCDAHASCTNLEGVTTPVCSCLPGYTGNGALCTTVDPCAVANGGCDINALCTYVAATPTSGSGSSNAAAPQTPVSKCVCLDGFHGDGQSCLACTRCGAGQYEKSACEGPNDTVCASCTQANCPAGSGVNGLGGHLCTATADQLCAPCPALTFNDGSHANCSVCTQCTVGEMVERMCTSNADTLCGPTSVPSAESQSSSSQNNWSQSNWSIVAYVAIGVAALLLIIVALCCRCRREHKYLATSSTGPAKDPTSPTTANAADLSADDWPGLVRRRRLSVELQSPRPSPEDEVTSPTEVQSPTPMTGRPYEQTELISPTSSRRPGESVQHILRNV